MRVALLLRNLALTQALCVAHRAVDHTERVRPRRVDVRGTDAQYVSPVKFRAEVSIVVVGTPILTVPLFAIDLEPKAVLHNEVLMPKARHVPLGLDPVADTQQSAAHDRLIS